jgi:hypothetical protein
MKLSCACNSPSVTVETDRKACWIECTNCRRIVGGLNKSEAIKMWNAATKAIKENSPA